MSLFDQMKQLKQMKDLQNNLGKEKISLEKDGVKVVVNGKVEIEEIVLNPSLNLVTQQGIVKDLINEAVRKIQMEAAQQFVQLSGN